MHTYGHILPRLGNSVRGHIFLCNLAVALRVALINCEQLRRALRHQLSHDIRMASEENLLGSLSSVLQHTPNGLLMQNRFTMSLAEFSSGARVKTVMSYADYQGYYQDPEDACAGHAPDELLLEGTSTRFRAGARTKGFFWVAPVGAVPVSCATHGSLAEDVRDLLGLVHRERNVPLVALSFNLPADQCCYRPSVVEANPNSRFCQLGPKPSNVGWGYTVDLRLVDAPFGTSIFGAPELVCSQVRLADCTGVQFDYLGATKTTRANDSAHERFRDHLLYGYARQILEDECDIADPATHERLRTTILDYILGALELES